MRLLAALGLSLTVLSGCTITAINEQQEQGASNTCSSDDDCDNRHCLENVCQATAGQFELLLLEVTPPSDSRLAHIPLITKVDQVPTSGGELDLSLTRAARVTGSMSIPPGSGCEMAHFYFPDGTQASGSSPSEDGLSIPVTVTLTPRTALLGLPSQTYQVQANELTVAPVVGGQYVFDVQVPAGEYDVYIAPPVRQEGCQVPPQLYRRQAILTDTNLQFTFAPASKPLSVTIAFPSSSNALKGWIVDIIERVSGNRLSTEQVLDEPDANGNYFAKLAYSKVNDRKVPADDVEAETDLLRLRPPAELVAPTIYADRAGLGLFGSVDKADLGAFTKFPTPVVVEGQLTGLDDGVPVNGHVRFVSTEIYGVDDGVFASYQTEIDVPETGLFSLQLPPGKYRVYAVPPLSPDERGLSALELSWDIPDDVPRQAGKLIELPRIANVVGSASLQGAQVYVVPSPQSVLPFEQVFGAAAFVPRATADMVDDRGSFRIEADPGRFDVSVRSSDASGFGWFVRPGFKVEPGGHEQELGRLALPEPSVVTGVARVTLGGDLEPALLPSSLIRAYVFLDKDLKYTRDQAQARSVIQVAETRSDSGGNYRLLVPASIDAAK
jgi:hypothetical protein